MHRLVGFIVLFMLVSCNVYALDLGVEVSRGEMDIELQSPDLHFLDQNFNINVTDTVLSYQRAYIVPSYTYRNFTASILLGVVNMEADYNVEGIGVNLNGEGSLSYGARLGYKYPINSLTALNVAIFGVYENIKADPDTNFNIESVTKPYTYEYGNIENKAVGGELTISHKIKDFTLIGGGSYINNWGTLDYALRSKVDFTGIDPRGITNISMNHDYENKDKLGVVCGIKYKDFLIKANLVNKDEVTLTGTYKF